MVKWWFRKRLTFSETSGSFSNEVDLTTTVTGTYRLNLEASESFERPRELPPVKVHSERPYSGMFRPLSESGSDTRYPKPEEVIPVPTLRTKTTTPTPIEGVSSRKSHARVEAIEIPGEEDSFEIHHPEPKTVRQENSTVSYESVTVSVHETSPGVEKITFEDYAMEINDAYDPYEQHKTPTVGDTAAKDQPNLSPIDIEAIERESLSETADFDKNFARAQQSILDELVQLSRETSEEAERSPLDGSKIISPLPKRSKRGYAKTRKAPNLPDIMSPGVLMVEPGLDRTEEMEVETLGSPQEEAPGPSIRPEEPKHVDEVIVNGHSHHEHHHHLASTPLVPSYDEQEIFAELGIEPPRVESEPPRDEFGFLKTDIEFLKVGTKPTGTKMEPPREDMEPLKSEFEPSRGEFEPLMVDIEPPRYEIEPPTYDIKPSGATFNPLNVETELQGTENETQRFEMEPQRSEFEAPRAEIEPPRVTVRTPEDQRMEMSSSDSEEELSRLQKTLPVIEVEEAVTSFNDPEPERPRPEPRKRSIPPSPSTESSETESDHTPEPPPRIKIYPINPGENPVPTKRELKSILKIKTNKIVTFDENSPEAYSPMYHSPAFTPDLASPPPTPAPLLLTPGSPPLVPREYRRGLLGTIDEHESSSTEYENDSLEEDADEKETKKAGNGTKEEPVKVESDEEETVFERKVPPYEDDPPPYDDHQPLSLDYQEPLTIPRDYVVSPAPRTLRDMRKQQKEESLAQEKFNESLI